MTWARNIHVEKQRLVLHTPYFAKVSFRTVLDSLQEAFLPPLALQTMLCFLDLPRRWMPLEVDLLFEPFLVLYRLHLFA